MADKDFVVKNGLVVNSNVLVVNGSSVGVNTATPDALFVVAGTANLQGNVKITGGEINVTANLTVYGNTDFKNNVFVDKKLYVGNTATMVQNLPTIIQAVDNFNGFVMVSSQNLSIADDACADLLIYSDNTNGLTYFNDLGINNSRFDGRIHRIIVNAAASSWALGETVYQRNAAGANIAVGEIRDKVAVGNGAISLKIRVSEDDGLTAPLVDMADFVNTAASNLSLYATTSGTNADILHAVGFFSSEIIEGLSRRNYAFTIGKRGDGYLYNANSALTIGTTRGGMREITETISTSYSSGANIIVMTSGNTLNIKADMDVTGSGIATGTYITSVINSTAFRLSKLTTGPLASGTITARDEFYDLSEANNPIIFHVGGMMGKNEIARFSGTGNFTIGPNTTNRNSKLTVNGTANLVGQVNVSANVNVVGNINTTANVYGARGIYSSSVNVGIVTLGTTQANVGANVVLDAAGLKITGNTLIPSMNVSGGNITVGNTTVANSPTVQLVNTISSANVTPSGLATGNIVVNALGSTINVGANVWLNATTFAIGNATANVVIAPSDPNWVLSVKGDARVNGNLLVKGDATVNGQLIFANSVSVNGDFKPNANDSFDLGNSSLVWGAAYIKIVEVPETGSVTVGNSSLNSVSRFDSVRVSNATAFSNLAISSLAIGNTTVNGQYTAVDARVGNTTVNSVLSSTSLVIGNASVNSTVNAATISIGNVFTVTANATTVNATSIRGTSVNSTSVNSTSINSTSINSTSINSTSVNSTSMNASTITAVSITGNLSGNVLATTINSTSMNSFTVNATTVNAATFQVGTAFKANATLVTTANLTVLGNFQVTGTTTFVNTAVMDVTDANITLAKGAANPAAANGGGITLEGANAELVYISGSNTWLSNVGITVGNSTSNVVLSAASFTGNTVGIHTGNVVANTISGNLTGNVSSTVTAASANVTVGANVVINTSTIAVSNTTAISIQDAGLMRVGNGSITTAPQVVVQNTAGTTTINSNFISTTSLSGNLIGNVAATTITGNLAGNVAATTISASANIVFGSNVIANTSGNFSSHLGGFPAANYVKFSASGDVSLADGGTNSTITPAAGGVVFSNTTGMALTAVGTAGQILVSNAASTPVWTSPSVITVGDSSNLGGVSAASYQLNSTLAANVATMTALNANNLGGTAASFYDKFPAGTRILFHQTTAPTGWTKDTTHDNKALRVVSSTVGSGGSLSFTAAFASRTPTGTTSSESVSGTTGSTGVTGTTSTVAVTGTVGATTLSIAQIPSHNHTVFASRATSSAEGGSGDREPVDQTLTTSNTGGGGSHDHPFTGGSHSHTYDSGTHTHTFSGGSHSHTVSTSLDMSVQYVDVIIAYKN